MALDTAARWKLIRDVIVDKRTGTLVLQAGTRYFNWIVEDGNLICVSSTFEESNFTQFLREKKLTESTNFSDLRNRIDEGHSIGWLLLHQNKISEEEFCASLRDHWVLCASALFEPSAHLFWSGSVVQIKPEFIRSDLPLGEVLMQTSRHSIAVPSALRMVQEFKGPLRLCGGNPDLKACTEEEQRIWMHLRSGTAVKQMLQDAGIARIPCYKFLFLLWLCGYITDTRSTRSDMSVVPKIRGKLLERIPPEWVFPLCAGALIGVILAPAPDPEPLPAPAYKAIEPLDESLQKPAWSQKEEFNAKAQRHEDDE